ncbi:MAG: ring-cleaving dioxygenase [Candidatus Methylomirabilales bacterium]
MIKELRGIHHVTAITADPQQNIDFYLTVLGLRLVKKTVNFDDPGSYHLYYGDDLGHPGTIMTFFAWAGAFRGRVGTGQLTVTSFFIPQDSVGFWIERLRSHGVAVERGTRFDEEFLGFSDPDGLQLELVASPRPDDRSPGDRGPVDPEHAIRGLHAVTLAVSGPEATAELLTETMGFHGLEQHGNRFRLEAGPGGPASVVDLYASPGVPEGIVSAGTVHHVAWRTPDESQQRAWREAVIARGLDVTPVLDRRYFRSIYFREPGGVLFEIATDPPGFTLDESPEQLGTGLRLPPWLETFRPEVERDLPPIAVPNRAGPAG